MADGRPPFFFFFFFFGGGGGLRTPSLKVVKLKKLIHKSIVILIKIIVTIITILAVGSVLGSPPF